MLIIWNNRLIFEFENSQKIPDFVVKLIENVEPFFNTNLFQFKNIQNLFFCKNWICLFIFAFFALFNFLVQNTEKKKGQASLWNILRITFLLTIIYFLSLLLC